MGKVVSYTWNKVNMWLTHCHNIKSNIKFQRFTSGASLLLRQPFRKDKKQLKKCNHALPMLQDFI